MTINSKINITGAAIGISKTQTTFNLSFGTILIIISAVVFIINKKSLEERLGIKNTMAQKRKGRYYIINTLNKETYSLDEIKEFCKNEEYKKLLRNEYFSDLLRLYAAAEEKQKFIYRLFIKALSPKADPINLDKRLKQFKNVYKKFKDKIEYRNPKRIEKSISSDFDNKIYVRFENEKDTLWPEEDTIDFLLFDEVKVNPSRGPLFSIIPLNKLIEDEYLLNDGKTLNPKWSAQKRQDYLRDTYGIDVDTRQRNMIFFQIEKDAKIESYGNYENIVIEKKVPLVKVIKKK